MARPQTALDYKILDFYEKIDPGEDFALKRPPARDLVDRKEGPKNRRATGRYPLPYKLVEAYVDLGIAIELGRWNKAYSIYRYLIRILED